MLFRSPLRCNSAVTTNSSELYFSAATSSDVAALCDLEASYYPTDGYPAPFFYQALHQWPELLQVLKGSSEKNNALLGYCLGAPGQTQGELWLMSLLVDQSQRGMGYGKRLLQHWLKHVDGLGYQKLWLSVSPANSAAIRLYENTGFVIVTTKTDYLGVGEDRHIMRRDRPSKG